MADEPRNARIISILLRAMGVDECEPRVVPQLLEFMHRMFLVVVLLCFLQTS